MSESRPTEIAALIRYVQRSRCGNGHRKVIVLNSRLTILNEARRLNSPFCQWLDEHGMDATMMLDASKLTRRDKSVLLCCQLSASGVKAQHIRQMIDGRAFKRVVDSPDFNPRVLERVCKLAAEDRVPADRFVDEVSEAMSRPLMVWTDEYENHMQAEDRTLLNVLFSLSDGSVESEILKQCYDSRIGSIASVDSTRPSFEACVDRLNDSMLQIIAGPPRRLGVHNPSINDFLQATLESNPVEVRCLIRSSIYSDQILRLARVCDDDAIAELVDEALSGGAILSMPWVGVDAGTCYLKLAKSRDWKPCDSASLSKATAMCMERSRDHDPVFDLLEDVEYGFIPEVVADEVLPVILDDSRIRLVLEKWPDDKIPRYFDLARKYRPEESKTFSDAFGKWLAGRVDDAIEESVWSRAHDAREEFVECDEDGNAYIPESAEDECVSLLLSDAKQDALSTLEQLFSGHEEVLDWLDVDVWGFILEFSTSVDCLSIVEQTIGWESTDHHDKSNPDISDEEIERALGSLVNDFGSKR